MQYFLKQTIFCSAILENIMSGHRKTSYGGKKKKKSFVISSCSSLLRILRTCYEWKGLQNEKFCCFCFVLIWIEIRNRLLEKTGWKKPTKWSNAQQNIYKLKQHSNALAVLLQLKQWNQFQT